MDDGLRVRFRDGYTGSNVVMTLAMGSVGGSKSIDRECKRGNEESFGHEHCDSWRESVWM